MVTYYIEKGRTEFAFAIIRVTGVVPITYRCMRRTVFQKGVVIFLSQYVCSYNVTSLRAEFKVILNVLQHLGQ